MHKTGADKVQSLVITFVLIWSAVVGASLAWNITEEHDKINNLAHNEASAYLYKDLAFRHWAASHGGVYVPVTERTQPNPVLSHIAERDITTPSGKKLTLMNPAYMLRQMIEDHPVAYGVKGRIVSRTPLREQNRADQWETEALDIFEKGREKERFALSVINGVEYARLIMPFVTKTECLKCHEAEGYKEGDISGGLSVAIPMAAYSNLLMRAERFYILTHGGIWLLGLAGIVLASRRLRLSHSQLLSSLRDKEVLLRELHHRVKNNLAVISALQGLEASRTENTEVRRVLDESQNRIRSIALVHEKLYRGADLASINAKDYIEGLIGEIGGSLAASTGGPTASFDLQVERMALDIDTLIPCGLILNELVTNSFKHAFASDYERAVIGVSLTRKGSEVELRAWDNGRGFDVALSSAKGSLGLSIVNTLSAQLEGRAEITSTPEGTSCTVRFPYSFDNS